MRKPTTLAILLVLMAAAAPVALGDSHAGNETDTDASGSAVNESAGNTTAPPADEDARADGNATAGGNATDPPPADDVANGSATPDGEADAAGGGPVLDEGVSLVELGYDECAPEHTVPPAVADDVGGGPSVLDYVETLCRAPQEVQSTGTQGLDLGARIILVLFLLIAFGIWLAIWVRRSYTP